MAVVVRAAGSARTDAVLPAPAAVADLVTCRIGLAGVGGCPLRGLAAGASRDASSRWAAAGAKPDNADTDSLGAPGVRPFTGSAPAGPAMPDGRVSAGLASVGGVAGVTAATAASGAGATTTGNTAAGDEGAVGATGRGAVTATEPDIEPLANQYHPTPAATANAIAPPPANQTQRGIRRAGRLKASDPTRGREVGTVFLDAPSASSSAEYKYP